MKKSKKDLRLVRNQWLQKGQWHAHEGILVVAEIFVAALRKIGATRRQRKPLLLAISQARRAQIPPLPALEVARRRYESARKAVVTLERRGNKRWGRRSKHPAFCGRPSPRWTLLWLAHEEFHAARVAYEQAGGEL